MVADLQLGELVELEPLGLVSRDDRVAPPWQVQKCVDLRAGIAARPGVELADGQRRAGRGDRDVAGLLGVSDGFE